MADFRHALRMIGRTPMLAVVIVLSLGAGIGVTRASRREINSRSP